LNIRTISEKLISKLIAKQPAQVEYDPGAWQKLDNTWDNKFTDSGWLNYRLNIVEWVLNIQEDHEDMLDIGCHIGHFIEELRQRGYNKRYQGVDLTLQFIERARERMPKENFAIGDVLNLDSPDKAFDLVMCVGVLMHIPEIKKPLAHVFRIARKYVLLSTYGSEGETYSRHDAKNGFLNHFYSKASIMAEVPPNWNLIEYKEFKRPDRKKDNMIFQFLLKK
jgi:2-polyprenyl-3-methyl-5-hydroxy-6-metoxy-1,4-benzoquinol methylase